MEEFVLTTSHITLGQLLKHCALIQSGGQAKQFLLENEVRVNGTAERRRGRKLVSSDVVEVEGWDTIKIVPKQ